MYTALEAIDRMRSGKLMAYGTWLETHCKLVNGEIHQFRNSDDKDQGAVCMNLSGSKCWVDYVVPFHVEKMKPGDWFERAVCGEWQRRMFVGRCGIWGTAACIKYVLFKEK